jgi:uncharacterized protein YecT (DUF1311 family)
MNYLRKFFALILLLALSGCESVEYDYKNLGFSDKAEMEAAFAKGYHTKQKLVEMTPAPVVAIAEVAVASAPVVVAEVAALAPLASAPDPVAEPAPGPPAVPTQTTVPVTEVVDVNPFAPSFDCTKASNGVERLICSDRELAKLDVALSQLYFKARSNAVDKDRLKSEQIAWVRTSRACSDKNCLKQSFEQRMADLSK